MFVLSVFEQHTFNILAMIPIFIVAIFFLNILPKFLLYKAVGKLHAVI